MYICLAIRWKGEGGKERGELGIWEMGLMELMGGVNGWCIGSSSRYDEHAEWAEGADYARGAA